MFWVECTFNLCVFDLSIYISAQIANFFHKNNRLVEER